MSIITKAKNKLTAKIGLYLPYTFKWNKGKIVSRATSKSRNNLFLTDIKTLWLFPQLCVISKLIDEKDILREVYGGVQQH